MCDLPQFKPPPPTQLVSLNRCSTLKIPVLKIFWSSQIKVCLFMSQTLIEPKCGAHCPLWTEHMLAGLSSVLCSSYHMKTSTVIVLHNSQTCKECKLLAFLATFIWNTEKRDRRRRLMPKLLLTMNAR